MNKITKYITTGAAAMLLLMSVGAVQTNANASRHYQANVSRYAKKDVRRGNKRQRRNHKTQYKANKNKATVNRKQGFKKQKVQKHQRAKAVQINKQNKKNFKKTVRHYRKHATRRGKRLMNHYARHLNRRRNHWSSKRVMKARYRIVPGNKRGNRALRKTNFYDGYALAHSGYSPLIAKYVFSKYAPFDKRAVIPSYMNPKRTKYTRKYHFSGNAYRNINDFQWVVGYFDPYNTSKNTKHPKVYFYNAQRHGWQLDARI